MIRTSLELSQELQDIEKKQGGESRRLLPKQTRWPMPPKSRFFPFFSEISDVLM
jgi:hypothetical protein